MSLLSDLREGNIPNHPHMFHPFVLGFDCKRYFATCMSCGGFFGISDEVAEEAIGYGYLVPSAFRMNLWAGSRCCSGLRYCLGPRSGPMDWV